MDKNTAQQVNLRLDGSSNALEIISQHCDCSIAYIKQIAHQGCIWFQSNHSKPRRVRRLKSLNNKQGELFIYHDPAVLNQQPLAALLIKSFGQYSIWHKPRGMLVQGSKWSDHTALERVAEQQLIDQAAEHQQVLIVHRLDKMTSGLIILAHTKQAAQQLTALFEQRQVNKQYQALVHGEVKLEQDAKLTIDQSLDGKPAITYLLDSQPCNASAESAYSLVTVAIETGRKHQIRQHLASIGHPVVGDRLYGITAEAQEGKQEGKHESKHKPDLQLCAVHIDFICPLTNEPRTVDYPAEFDERLINANFSARDSDLT
jgi:tRNA pseudouridine32 synthase / 23S rRNA pseudouridine746 synthase